MYKCKRCGKEYENILSLSRHTYKLHKVKAEELFMELNPTASCKCKQCGSPTFFEGITKGYRTFCSKKCSNMNEEKKEKFINTCLEKYGEVNPMCNPEIRKKSEETYFKKTGYRNPSLNPDTIKTIGDKFEAKYGSRNIFESLKVTYPGTEGKQEKFIKEFLKNRKIPFKQHVLINGKNFDFAILNDDGSYNTVIEIDGEFFHGLVSDSDNNHVMGHKDSERFRILPEGIKFIVADSGNANSNLTKLIVDTIGLDYDKWIQDILLSLPTEFPFPSYTERRMLYDFNRLKTYKFKRGQTLGMSIVRNFHPSIWKCKVGNNISPFEAWNDRSMLEKCVKNRFIYKSVLSSHNIADGFSKCKLAPKISVFNPSLAKYLIETYLPESEVIIDPFSGFSGRMLGAIAADRKYIGYDINPTTVRESNEIINFLQLSDASIECKDVNTLSVNNMDSAVLTCPPYNLKETWGIPLENRSCDEWIDITMNNIKAKEYLFVVDKTEKYKDYIVETLSNRSHFGENSELILRIR